MLSRSTEEYDRGHKFEHYKTLDSLRQYVLVSQTERRVQVWTRAAGDTWTQAVAVAGEVAALTTIDAQLDVRALYDAAAEPAA